MMWLSLLKTAGSNRYCRLRLVRVSPKGTGMVISVPLKSLQAGNNQPVARKNIAPRQVVGRLEVGNADVKPDGYIIKRITFLDDVFRTCRRRGGSLGRDRDY